MIYEQVMTISFRQFAVFDATITSPFNRWTPEHFAQGFCYRPGTVSFMTLSEDGLIRVTITDELFQEQPAIRIYTMPLEVSGLGGLEVATITDSLRVNIPNGRYKLNVYLGQDKIGEDWCFVNINKSVAWPIMPEMLKKDKDITKDSDFLMDAEPA